MESAGRSSARRKPLSDRTNTIAAASVRRSKPRPHKSNTSTGSNNPPDVDSLLFDSDPLSPPTPLPDTGRRDRRKIEPPAAQSRKDENISKDKTNMSSTTPVIQVSKPPVRQTLLRSSSTTTGSTAVHNDKHDAEERTDKGKMVLETPNIETTDLLRPPVPLSTSSGSLRNCHLSGPPEAQNLKLDEQKRMDKGKGILLSPIIEVTDIPRPNVSMASSSAVGTWYRSGFPAQKSKDKEKMVLETPIIETTDIFRPHMSLSSSSATSGNGHLLWSPAVQNKKPDAQERKYKGKNVLDSLSNETSNSLRLHDPLTSFSDASGNCCISGPPASGIQKINAPKSKDKQKMAQKFIDNEATTPSSTPRASSSAASGTCDQERTISLTVYSERRAPRRRKSGDGMTMPLSCPPKKRIKNNGLKLDDDRDKSSGSHKDPLPRRKKKQSRNKHKNDSAYNDEIERLKAMYDEIDKFELPVEVASESD